MGIGPGSIGSGGVSSNNFGEDLSPSNAITSKSNPTQGQGRGRAKAINKKEEQLEIAIKKFNELKKTKENNKNNGADENSLTRSRNLSVKASEEKDAHLAERIIPEKNVVTPTSTQRSQIQIGARSTSPEPLEPVPKRPRHIKREKTPELQSDIISDSKEIQGLDRSQSTNNATMPIQITNYNKELEIFLMAVLKKSDPYIQSEVLIKYDQIMKNNPHMTAKDLLKAKHSLCDIAGVSFKEIHPTYAAMRKPKPVNQNYNLGTNVMGVSQKTFVASVNGVKNHEGKVYTSLDREAEGASNLQCRKVGDHKWYTAGVCAAYAHNTKNVMRLTNGPPNEFTKKIKAFREELVKHMSKQDANKIIENIMGAENSIIKNSDIEHLAGSEALLTSFVRVFDVLDAMVREMPENKDNDINLEKNRADESKKILWQRIMAPDIVRATLGKVSDNELNGNNERLMSHMEIAILNVFKEVKFNGQKLDISYINTPINEMAKKGMTLDRLIDSAALETKKRLLADLENRINRVNPETHPIEYRELLILRALSKQEGRFAESVFTFAAAQKLGYEIMLGCKSGKDRTGFFSAIASTVLLEVDRLAQSEHFDEKDLNNKIFKLISGDLSWDQWKKLVALTLPHMFEIPAFNQGLVGLKANNVLDSMWKCFNSQLKVQGKEVLDLANSNRARAFFLVMLLQGSGGVEGFLNWIPKDDPNSPFNDSQAQGALEALNALADITYITETNKAPGPGLLDITDEALDGVLKRYPDFSGKLALLDGEKISKEWLNGATYAGI